LFDDADGIESVSKEGQIFNGRTFLHPYLHDLNCARRSIVISSPKLCKVSKNSLMSRLKDLTARGLEVVILTSDNSGQVENLLHCGLTVKVSPDISLCSTVIDRSTVWYGGINVLGYASEDDSMIKVVDSNLADELLGILFPV